MQILYVLSALCILGGTLSVSPSSDGCQDFPSQPNFEIDRFKGRWYLKELYVSSVLPEGFSSGSIDFNLKNDNKVQQINVVIDKNGTALNYTSTSSFSNSSEPAQFTTKVDTSGLEFNERVLDTDYDSYAIMYKCRQTNADGEPQSYDHFFTTLTRHQNQPNLPLDKISKFLLTGNVDPWYLYD